jgi:pimeloyl-ACP methyl ester carboxylesterase
MGMLQANYEGGTIAYRKSGSGPVIVLIHGFPEDGELWHKIIPPLSASFTLLVPDLPGAGGSPLPEQELSMELMAAGVRAVLEQEAVGQAVIVGHSMGGYTALSLAASHPSLVKGLSLVHSTATADNDEKKQTRRKAIALIRKGGKEAFVRQMVPGLFSEAFKSNQNGQINGEIEKGLKLKDESMIAFYNAMINRPDRTANLKGGFPVQWVIGKEDSVVPEALALKQATMSDVSFVSVYHNAAHMSMIEQPELLAVSLGMFAAYCYKN